MGHDRHRLTRALLALAGVTLFGTIGFTQIEGWSLWDSFYFTLITITTVGYGDQGLSEIGRKFASLLLIGGVATASYSFAVILQESIAQHMAWRERMQKQIDRLSGHTIVCGFGRMGRSICERLRELGEPFVLIEKDQLKFEQAAEIGFPAVLGSGSEDESLRLAGVERARHVVGAVDSIAENILIAMSARELHAEAKILARAETPEDVRKLRRAGVHRVISPFRSGGGEIANLITKPMVAEFLDRANLADGGVALADLTIEEGSPLIGRSLAEYGRSEDGRHVCFVALERAGESTQVPPPGSAVLIAGDHLILAGDPTQVQVMQTVARRSRAA